MKACDDGGAYDAVISVSEEFLVKGGLKDGDHVVYLLDTDVSEEFLVKGGLKVLSSSTNKLLTKSVSEEFLVKGGLKVR